MSYRQCDVIGCPEAAAWVRAGEFDKDTGDFLCNPCWIQLRAKQPQQAAYYVVCSQALARPEVRQYSAHIHKLSSEEVILIS